MATISQVQVAWTGAPGMPGVSTMYFSTADSLTLADVRAFFSSIASVIPPNVRLVFPAGGKTIDSATGQPNGSWTGTKPTDVVGTGPVNYAAPVGATVNWRSDLFVNGRQLRGKTFLVPLSTNSFDSAGTLDNTVRTSIQSAADLLRTTPAIMQVYGRSTHITAPVRSADVPDRAMVLTTRRA